MKYSKTILLFSILFNYGCTKEQSTNYIATLTNTTQHKIVILSFKGGIVYPEDTITLNPNDKLKIADGTVRGLVTVPLFFSKYFGGSDDSMIVVFDNLYKIAHYTNTPNKLSNKYYLFSSLRNIGNPSSYRFETIETSHTHRQNTHFYDFIEQDYLDAK